MHVEQRHTPDHVRLLPHGELDMATAPILRAAIDAAVAEHREIVIDFDGVDFVDVRGLRLLLELEDVARVEGCTFRVVPCRALLDLIELLDAEVELPLAG